MKNAVDIGIGFVVFIGGSVSAATAAGGQIAELQSEVRDSVTKRRSVMKLQRTFICIAGMFIAVGFAASQAVAGEPDGVSGCGTVPDDDGNGFMEIEVNALRAGGKTIVTTRNDTTKVTSKARIRKGTAPIATTMVTTLTIEAWTDVTECVAREHCVPLCGEEGNACLPGEDPDLLCELDDHDPEPDTICVPLCGEEGNACLPGEDPDPICASHDPTELDPDPDCLLHDEVNHPFPLGKASKDEITIAVGKGGKGATLTLDTTSCGPSEFITFIAEFRGEDEEGESCVGERELRKACR